MSKNFVIEVLAILNGLAALVVIFYFMTAELLVHLSVVGDCFHCLHPFLYIIPQTIALITGFFSNFLFAIPGLVAVILGVAGTPLSWPELYFSLEEAYWPPGKSIVDFIFGVIRFFFISGIFGPDFEPKEIPPPPTQISRNDSESWVFINGIATTEETASLNTKQIYSMFGRPVITAYNPANGLLIDLIECIIWKVGVFNCCNRAQYRSREKLIEILKRELKKEEKKKVVLIAHSQGTIITGNMIEELSADAEFALLMKQKLEVYTFANCAQVMSSEKVLRLENLYNRRDTVAWIGQLYPFQTLWIDDKSRPIRISGVPIEERTQWGHLLNTHYLIPMMRPTISGRRRFGASNLWNYYDGKYDAGVEQKKIE